MKDDILKRQEYTDEDIESLLSPRCDFHTSSGFAARVIKEAETQNRRGLTRRILIPIAASVAAAVAVIATLSYSSGKSEHYPETLASATTPSALTNSVDTRKIHDLQPAGSVVSSNISMESSIEQEQTVAPLKKSYPKKDICNIAANSESQTSSQADIIAASLPDDETSELMIAASTNAEGPMKSLSELREEPDIIMAYETDSSTDYLQKLQISFINRTRSEVEATKAFLQNFSQNEHILNPI